MTFCATCQGRNRETTDMVCMTCGRDYMPDDGSDVSDPGLGWKRLMGLWREQCKQAEAKVLLSSRPFEEWGRYINKAETERNEAQDTAARMVEKCGQAIARAESAETERDQVYTVNQSLATQVHEALLRAEKAELDARNYKFELDAAHMEVADLLAVIERLDKPVVNTYQWEDVKRFIELQAAVNRVRVLCSNYREYGGTLTPEHVLATLDGAS